MSWRHKSYDELPEMFRELVDTHTKPIYAERDRYKAALLTVRESLFTAGKFQETVDILDRVLSEQETKGQE